MKPAELLDLPAEERQAAFQTLINSLEHYSSSVEQYRVSPSLDAASIRDSLNQLDFGTRDNAADAIEYVVRNLQQYQVHTPHPMYFGLFNPKPTTMAIVADGLAAGFNPQLAAWSHSPFAVEAEQYLIREFCVRFGFDRQSADGTFTSGGAEANHTALLCALNWKFPAVAELGVKGLAQQPVFYVTSQSHHSFAKAARLCGLGNTSIREVPLDSSYRMDAAALREQIRQDRADGCEPFLIDATGGSTNAGIVDPIAELSTIAREEGIWFHVDAAWGGAAALVPELLTELDGIHAADSITFDAHKWLSVSMGAGMFLTRHPHILDQTFRITTDYMPREGSDIAKIDPYSHSMQWSRRFIGLKLFMSLLVAGWDGYAEVIRHQTAMGNLLREELLKNNWNIVNRTNLPTVCFCDLSRPDGQSATFIDRIVQDVVASGKAWISSTRLGGGLPVIRACITNYRTEERHIHALVHLLNETRQNMIVP